MVLRGCPVCSRGAWAFEPLSDSYFGEWRRWGFPYAPEDFETLNVRDYACPSCHSPDRDRMCAIWIGRRAVRTGSLLDVGPSPSLAGFLRTRFDYLSLDAIRDADVRGDVQELTYSADSFDAFVCSHVLEHVPDDRRALAELRRVLRPDGWGIVMVPVCLLLQRWHVLAAVAGGAATYALALAALGGLHQEELRAILRRDRDDAGARVR